MWSALVKKVAPLPIGPSRSEVHARPADRSPSVASGAVAAKGVPRLADTSVPVVGAVTRTGGGVGVVVTGVVGAVRVAGGEGAAGAVMVWVPWWCSVAVRFPPVPRSPSRFDVQWSAGRESSKSSSAPATSVTGVPAGRTVLPAGAVIVTVG